MPDSSIASITHPSHKSLTQASQMSAQDTDQDSDEDTTSMGELAVKFCSIKDLLQAPVPLDNERFLATKGYGTRKIETMNRKCPFAGEPGGACHELGLKRHGTFVIHLVSHYNSESSSQAASRENTDLTFRIQTSQSSPSVPIQGMGL